MANARETLRRYLEQRIELGEHAIVLETLAATDVIKTARVDNAGRDTTPSPGASSVRLADWRTALQESGAAPPVEKADRPALPSLDSLAAIEAAVAGCRLCPLYATATNPVPGEGNPNADFMVVGEAPGATVL